MSTRKQYPRAHNKESTQSAQDAEAIALGGADIVPSLPETGDGASGGASTKFARGIYVGTGGTVKLDTMTQVGLLFKNVPAGTFLPIWVTKVYATANGTTAADLLFLY